MINFLSNRPAHNGEHTEGTFVVKSGLAQMCKGGLIMDVVNVEQAKIAEEAGVETKHIFVHFEIIFILVIVKWNHISNTFRLVQWWR